MYRKLDGLEKSCTFASEKSFPFWKTFLNAASKKFPVLENFSAQRKTTKT